MLPCGPYHLSLSIYLNIHKYYKYRHTNILQTYIYGTFGSTFANANTHTQTKTKTFSHGLLGKLWEFHSFQPPPSPSPPLRQVTNSKVHQVRVKIAACNATSGEASVTRSMRKCAACKRREGWQMRTESRLVGGFNFLKLGIFPQVRTVWNHHLVNHQLTSPSMWKWMHLWVKNSLFLTSKSLDDNSPTQFTYYHTVVYFPTPNLQ